MTARKLKAAPADEIERELGQLEAGERYLASGFTLDEAAANAREFAARAVQSSSRPRWGRVGEAGAVGRARHRRTTPEVNDISLEPDPEHLVTRAEHCAFERAGSTWSIVDGGDHECRTRSFLMTRLPGRPCPAWVAPHHREAAGRGHSPVSIPLCGHNGSSRRGSRLERASAAQPGASPMQKVS